MYNIPKYLYSKEIPSREFISHTEHPRFIAEIFRAKKHDPEITRANEYPNKIELTITDCYETQTEGLPIESSFDERFVIAVLENIDQASNEDLDRELLKVADYWRYSYKSEKVTAHIDKVISETVG